LVKQVYFLVIHLKINNLQFALPKKGLVEDLDDLRPEKVSDRDDFDIGVTPVRRVNRLAEVNSDEQILVVEKVKLPVGDGLEVDMLLIFDPGVWLCLVDVAKVEVVGQLPS
jgi:hypothetical protein